MFKADPKRHPSCSHLMLLPRAASLPPWPPWAYLLLPVGPGPPGPPLVVCFLFFNTPARPPPRGGRRLGPPLTERSKRDGPAHTPRRRPRSRLSRAGARTHISRAELAGTGWRQLLGPRSRLIYTVHSPRTLDCTPYVANCRPVSYHCTSPTCTPVAGNDPRYPVATPKVFSQPTDAKGRDPPNTPTPATELVPPTA